MALMNWNENMSVKIASIDSQHKKLIKMVNDLHEAMMEGKGSADSAMNSIFNDLVTYTVSHFATEEKFFKTYNYPKTAEHIKEHEALKAKAIALQSDFKSGKLTISIQTLNFLKDWLTKHIMITDKEYVPFLLEKGVK